MSFEEVSPIMTTEEAARYLQLDPLTVRYLARAGAIPAFKVGKLWRVKRDLLDRWFEEQSTQDAGG
jgi:excisionase family DNA binding protein